jgi:hypothetical protein
LYVDATEAAVVNPGAESLRRTMYRLGAAGAMVES